MAEHRLSSLSAPSLSDIEELATEAFAGLPYKHDIVGDGSIAGAGNMTLSGNLANGGSTTLGLRCGRGDQRSRDRGSGKTGTGDRNRVSIADTEARTDGSHRKPPQT